MGLNQTTYGDQRVTEPELAALAGLVAQMRQTRIEHRRAMADLRDAVQMANQQGVSKYRIVQVTGLARNTVDAWTS